MSEPFVPAEPGQVISAEIWNQMQCDIRDHIAGATETIKNQVVEGEIVAKEAENAKKFANKDETDWKKFWNDTYIRKDRLQEELGTYRRYIRYFTLDQPDVFLKHELGRYPLVDTYELLPVTDISPHQNCKILIYYGRKEARKYKLGKEIGRDEMLMGDPLEQWLYELGIPSDDDQVVDDLISDLRNALGDDDHGELELCHTEWVEDKCCRKKATVGDLKTGGIWGDLKVAIRPVKCGIGVEMRGGDQPFPEKPCVPVTQLNRDTLYVDAKRQLSLLPESDTGEPPSIHLMFLLT